MATEGGSVQTTEELAVGETYTLCRASPHSRARPLTPKPRVAMGGRCPCVFRTEHETQREAAEQSLQVIEPKVQEARSQLNAKMQQERALVERVTGLRQQFAGVLSRPEMRDPKRRDGALSRLPVGLKEQFMHAARELRTVRKERKALNEELRKYSLADEALSKLTTHARSNEALRAVYDIMRKAGVDIDQVTEAGAEGQLLAQDMQALSAAADVAEVPPEAEDDRLLEELMFGTSAHSDELATGVPQAPPLTGLELAAAMAGPVGQQMVRDAPPAAREAAPPVAAMDELDELAQLASL
jgi:hypothetical protein